MGYNFSPKIMSDGLVLYLDAANTKSYNGSGTVWNDLSRETNNGVLINGPTFDSNNLGSIIFDGTNDYVEVSNSTSLNPTQTITLCAWVRFNGIYSGFNAPIIFKKNNSTSFFEQYYLGFTTSGRVNFALGDGSSNQGMITPNSYTNQLINVVGVIDTNNSILKIYINGILIQTQSISYPSMDVSSNPVVIGAYNQPFSGFMGGNIYNVSIYNRIFSDVEILQNYNSIKGRFNL